MDRRIEIKLAADIVLPLLDIVREQAAAVVAKPGLHLNGAVLTPEGLTDIDRLLHLFGPEFTETAKITINADVALALVRACSLLRLHLRIDRLSAMSDRTLQEGMDPALFHGAEAQAATAYVFLGTLLEITLRDLGDAITGPNQPVIHGLLPRIRALFERRRVPVSANPVLIPTSEIGVKWAVVVLDDPVNSMAYVTAVFQRILGVTPEDARKHMKAVHESGRSVVWAGGREDAELRMRALHAWHLNAMVEGGAQTSPGG